MDSLIINSTEDTPKVICDKDGSISIIGKSINEDPAAFYKPVLDWIQEIKVENLVIYIKLEYLNTSSSKQIFELLKLAKENKWKKTISVKWFYDMNDEDEQDLGKEFEFLLGIPFEFFNFLSD